MNFNRGKLKVESLVHVLLSIIIMVGAMKFAQVTSNLIGIRMSLDVMSEDMLYALIYIFSVLIVGLTYAKKVLHLATVDIGVKKSFPKMKWFIIGILLPTAVTVFYFIFVEGTISRNSIYSLDGKITTIVSAIFVTGISAGIVEEFIFRGLIMSIFAKAWGRKTAIIVPSFLFAAAHLSTINKWNIIDAMLLVAAGTMAGIMFSLIAYQSSLIWSSAMVHALWNIIIIGNILQITSVETGLNINSIYYYKLKGCSNLITGGVYGIEIGVPAIIGYLLISVVILRQLAKKESLKHTG